MAYATTHELSDQQVSEKLAEASIAAISFDQSAKYFLIEHFVVAFGYNTAAFLGYLVNKHFYYESKGQMATHKKLGYGFFYFTIEDAVEELHLSRDEQDGCIAKLKKFGIVQSTTMGAPPRRYFKIDMVMLNNYLKSEKISSKLRNFPNLNCGKSTIAIEEFPQFGHINNIYTSNKNNSPNGHVSAPPKGDAKTIPFESASKEKKLERAPGVSVTDDEHSKLKEQYGEAVTNEGYLELSEWKKSANPAQVKKHASDYYRLRKWVIPTILESREKTAKGSIAAHRRNSKLLTPGDYEEDTFKRKRL